MINPPEVYYGLFRAVTFPECFYLPDLISTQSSAVQAAGSIRSWQVRNSLSWRQQLQQAVHSAIISFVRMAFSFITSMVSSPGKLILPYRFPP